MTHVSPHLLKIAIIGAGNVASHLAIAIAEYVDIVQIASHTESSSAELAAELISRREYDRCEAIHDLSLLRNDCDLYLISVNDDAIDDVIRSTPDFPGIWAHTSGSVPMSVFAGKKSRYGVFYPLQTFTKGLDVNMKEVPMMIEGNTSETADFLQELAQKISDRVKIVDDDVRRKIHLAAVFACNFANQMWAEADDILKEVGLDVTYLLPLIQTTVDKLHVLSPYNAMTGPARRGDIHVAQTHLQQLTGAPYDIYQLLTQRIRNIYS